MASMPIVHKSEGHDKENKNNKYNSDTKIVANQIKELSLTENITETKSTLPTQQNALQEVKSSPVLGDKTPDETTHNKGPRREETTSELKPHRDLVSRLRLKKKKNKKMTK